MTVATTSERKRPVRGQPYSLEEFEQKYARTERAPRPFLSVSARRRSKLDLLMAAKKRTPPIHAITEDLRFELRR